MSRNKLKLIAIAAMTLDHITMLIPDMIILNYIFHFAGRITAPIMCFFISEGYYYTSDIKKYICRLFLLSVISWIPYTVFQYEKIVLEFSVITDLLIGLIMVYIFDHQKHIFSKVILLFVLLSLTIFCDWSIFVPLWILIFHIYRCNVVRRNIGYMIIAVLYCLFVVASTGETSNLIWSGGVFAVPFILSSYKQNKIDVRNNSFDNKIINKWFFYIYYPLHLMILQLLK